jgi:hypothetical protein
MRYHSRPSGPVLATLGLFWIALLIWSLYVAIDLWPRDHHELVMAQVAASTSFGAAFGEGMRTAAPKIHLMLVAGLSAPLLVMTWLALPRGDRRTFPVILILWSLGIIVAYSEWLPTSDGVVFALVCVSVIAVAEVLRLLITAMVRHSTQPLESREASV